MTSVELKVKQALKLKIPFIDLKAQQQHIRIELDSAIARVLDHGVYIMGPEVAELEQQLAAFCGVKYAITCSNGTDALALCLRAKQIGSKDAIFVPSFTFASTAEVVAWVGAIPIFIDVLPDTFNMDPKSLEQGIQTAKKLGLKPSGIIPVDMFGQPADYDAIQAIADQHQLWVLADGAQSFGALYKGKCVGNIGDMATTSFFPAKPLGCYGDGGAIFTNDEELAGVLKSLRVHGQGLDKYDNVRIGINGRLDTIQAAILLQKLKVFKEELQQRDKVAAHYSQALGGLVSVPRVMEGVTSAWAQYTVRLPKAVDRGNLMKELNEVGVPTMVYYPKPLHLQTAYHGYPTATGGSLPICEELANTVCSLPMSGYLAHQDVKYVIQNFLDCIGKI